MNCEAFEKWIYLYYEGELSPNEKEQLSAHLSVCKSCSEKLAKNLELKDLVIELRKTKPENSRAEEARNNILQRISLMPVQNYNNRGWKRNLIPGVAHPVFRMLSTAAAIFLLALFVRQQLEIKRELETLRVKMEQKNRPDNLTTSMSFNDSSLLLLKDHAQLRISDINEEELGTFIEKNKRLIEENTFVLNYLRKNYPNIFKEIMIKQKERARSSQNL